jgi:hypothetical protein
MRYGVSGRGKRAYVSQAVITFSIGFCPACNVSVKLLSAKLAAHLGRLKVIIELALLLYFNCRCRFVPGY